MSESVTMWRSVDGTVWDDRVKADKRDAVLKFLSSISFPEMEVELKHGEYIEVSPERLKEYKRAIWPFMVYEFGSWLKNEPADPDDVYPHTSFLSRVASDARDSPVGSAWLKMMAWDFELGRIYEQAYFVTHPNEAVMVEDER